MSGIKITKFDTIFRKILKLERQKRGMIPCAKCKKQYPIDDCAQLHVSHFITRANWVTRLERQNVDFHCYGCHSYLEGRPHEFVEWKKGQMGEKAYDALVLMSNSSFQDYYGMKKKLWLDEWYKDAKETLKDLEGGVVNKLREKGL